MLVFTEGKHATDGVLSEGNGNISRDEITIAAGSGVVEAMTVLGRYTSGANEGKYAPSPATASDPDVGHQTAVAINLYRVDATDADVKVAALTRLCTVIGANLTRHASINTPALVAAQDAELAASHIIVR